MLRGVQSAHWTPMVMFVADDIDLIVGNTFRCYRRCQRLFLPPDPDQLLQRGLYFDRARA